MIHILYFMVSNLLTAMLEILRNDMEYNILESN